MGSPRDSQRAKLYAGERKTYLWAPGKPDHPDRIDDVKQIDRWLKSRLKLLSIQKRYARELRRPIRVDDGRGCRSALGGGGVIKLPRWSRFKLVILHETAHVICERRYGDSVAAHGWQFAAIFLDLVQFGMGADARKELERGFKETRCRWRAPKKRKPMTADAKAVLADRLAGARAARAAKKVEAAAPAA